MQGSLDLLKMNKLISQWLSRCILSGLGFKIKEFKILVRSLPFIVNAPHQLIVQLVEFFRHFDVSDAPVAAHFGAYKRYRLL